MIKWLDVSSFKNIVHKLLNYYSILSSIIPFKLYFLLYLKSLDSYFFF